MRQFLPIKGPGGRYLTTKEKIALLILGVTLILCVLTLVAGESAYLSEGARNPIFSIVSGLGSMLGGGIVALYGLVLVWSALIYFKGERVADITPIGGRMAAAFAVTVGISGAFGIAQLDAAGGLGQMVGTALGNTFGPGAGFPILILLMLLGAHLASQGAWTALREPMLPAPATVGPGASTAGGFGFTVQEAPGRFQEGPPLPDDGDPSADERSLAVQQAMEEIERSQGVTIVEVEPEDEVHEEEGVEEEPEVADDTRSIGEEVHEAPEPGEDTEEAEVQRGLAAVAHALAVTQAATVDEEDTDEEEEVEEAQTEQTGEAEYEAVNHGFVPVPVGEQTDETAVEEEEDEAETAEDDEFAESYESEDDEEYETAEYEEDEAEEDEEAEYEEAEYEDEELLEEDDEELADEEAEYDEEADEEADEEDDEEEYEEEDEEEVEDVVYEAAEDEEVEEEEDDGHEQLELFEEEQEAEAEADEPVEAELAAEPAPKPVPEPEPEVAAEPEEVDGDPYAQGGLLRRLQANPPATEKPAERPHTAFDWRGRPIK